MLNFTDRDAVMRELANDIVSISERLKADQLKDGYSIFLKGKKVISIFKKYDRIVFTMKIDSGETINQPHGLKCRTGSCYKIVEIEDKGNVTEGFYVENEDDYNHALNFVAILFENSPV